MDLIVKIGPDQTALAQTAQRIKDQFKNANMSVPASWAPNNAAMSQYGSILQGLSGNTGGFSQFKTQLSEVSPMLGNIAGKFTELAGPLALIGGTLGLVTAAVHGTIEKLKEAAQIARESRITGFSASMIKNIRHAGERSMGADEAMAAMNKLNVSAGNFLAGDKGAQEMFGELGIDPSGMKSDDLVGAFKKAFAGINDPAKRARISKGIFGKGAFEISEMFSKLEADPSGMESDEVARLAQIKKGVSGWWSKFKRGLDKAATEVLAYGLPGGGGAPALDSQTIGQGGESAEAARKREDERAKAEAQYGKDRYNRMSPEMKLGFLINRQLESDQNAFNKTNRDTPEYYEAKNKLEQTQFEIERLRKEVNKPTKEKAEKDDKPLSFQADALAQAGLFSGSSLLLNPAMNIQQEQLEALRKIESNTSGHPIFDP